MPKYRYTGSEPFMDTTYSIQVNPGQEFETLYVLPSDWEHFTLLDLNSPKPILPQTQDYTIDSDIIEIDTSGYNYIAVVLKNPTESSIKIQCRDQTAPYIVLDSSVNNWFASKQSDFDYFSKIYLSALYGTANVTVYLGVHGSKYGEIGSGGGGSGTGCTMSISDPVPTSHGGLAAGTVIAGKSPCEVLEMILFPYQAPAFTAFYIEGQPTVLEVGDKVAGGVRTFKWSTSNSSNVLANTISIKNQAGDTLLSNSANDGSEDVNIGADIVETTASTYHWTISAVNTKNQTFTRSFNVSWEYRVYWGKDANATLDETGIKNLENSQLKTTYNGNYVFNNSAGDGLYYYVCYPDGFGSIHNWINNENGFGIDYTDNGTVDVTNTYGITITYRVLRTTYQQHGSLDTQIS